MPGQSPSRRRRVWVACLGVLVLTAGSISWAAKLVGEESPRGEFDTTQPIEITADALEIDQGPGLAVFTGNVNAVQGEMILRADTLKVHYRADGEEGDVGTQGRISRIEASGAVFFATPSATAQGNHGNYDVEQRIVTLDGSVVLTRGENVLRGSRLELNLDTGRSKLYSDEGSNGRVRGLFVPDETEQ